jgi:spermidine/putrescine transport system substrate-binding protein
MKKHISLFLALLLAGSALATLSSCNQGNVLRVANWAEYIDGGGADSELLREFEVWYEEQTGEKIRVEYSVADDNETLYNMIKMGDKFDLICPSEYMLMKLADEDRLLTFPERFYDTSIPTNYYAQYVSPFIKETFNSNVISETNQKPWSAYAAGYMWGTTGFVFNPESVESEDVQTWKVFTNTKYKNKITAKNNVRDSYFAGLAMHYENRFLELNTQFKNGTIDKASYQKELFSLANDTSEETMSSVKDILKSMTSNLYGFETDEGKNDTIAGKVTVNYQWSGDAVYIIDEAEEAGTILNYAIPDSVSNLWFDGWTMPKGCSNQNAAMMFINFLSLPENAVRNMEYIGYTSCIGGDAVFDTMCDWYGAEDDDETAVEYDLSYFFGEGYSIVTPEEQLNRQLFAQYPTEQAINRCVTMRYFKRDENARANNMWNDITFF